MQDNTAMQAGAPLLHSAFVMSAVEKEYKTVPMPGRCQQELQGVSQGSFIG